ncbi:MAG: serine hydrolase [Dokdonella sp.]|uniref:serine hydrolase n=1 Tax=Dokdonella sp. TaxID=2291710 RepID=UPI0032634698
MTRFALVLISLLPFTSAWADRLYSDSFEVPIVGPYFPRVGNTFALPAGPTTDQLAWIMSELAAGETTTPQEIAAHFDASWTVSVADTQAFFQSLRTSYPNAIIRDVVAVTPVQVTVVIARPDLSTPFGFLNLEARYSGAHGIVLFGVSNYSGSVQYAEDQGLDLAQSVAKFGTLSGAPAILVGRIGANDQCTALAELNSSQLRATASIFKLWVLAGLGRGIAQGIIGAEESITLAASQIASGGTINGEPLGTIFSLSDMATLMIGISDNTATDHVHHRVGRAAIDQAIDAYGVAQPSVLKPLLDISEQFHLFFTFPLATAQAYVDGTEPDQQQFIDEEIVPLGPYVPGSGAYSNTGLLTSGSWRATPMDICRAFAHHRHLPQGSDAIALVDRALSAQSAQPEVRNAWDRVWYKGGSLASSDGYHVLTHAWMLQNSGEDPYVVIAMSNSDTGGIDPYKVQSITGRILQLLAQLP